MPSSEDIWRGGLYYRISHGLLDLAVIRNTNTKIIFLP